MIIPYETFVIILLSFGVFWIIVEGLIAYWVYKIYKIAGNKSKDRSYSKRRR